MKVLVIGDEKKIDSLVRKGLAGHGFVVETSQSGDEAYLLATTRTYVDLGLGLSLAREIVLIHKGRLLLKESRRGHARFPVSLKHGPAG